MKTLFTVAEYVLTRVLILTVGALAVFTFALVVNYLSPTQ